MEQKKKIKVIIIVLACLLGLSLLALGGTLIYNKIANTTPATVTVPDNLITPDDDTTKPDSSDTEKPDSSDTQTPSNSAGTSSAVPAQSTTAETKKAATIELYNKQPEENTAFAVGNMFPGDSETKYFRVRVSYHDKITVHVRLSSWTTSIPATQAQKSMPLSPTSIMRRLWNAMHLLRSTIARFYFSAKLLARSSQTLSATRTSFLSGCRKMTATALRMA